MADIFYFTMTANIRDQWHHVDKMTVELDGRPEFFSAYYDALCAAERQFCEEQPDVVIVYISDWDCIAIAVSAVSRSSCGKASTATSHNLPIKRTERDARIILIRELDHTLYSGV